MDLALAGTQELLDATSTCAIPKHLSIHVARALTSVSANGCIVMEVMNAGAQPITLHSGTKLACFVSEHHKMVVGNGKKTVFSDPVTTSDEITLDDSTLTSEQ